jgi:hypothetical protein
MLCSGLSLVEKDISGEKDTMIDRESKSEASVCLKVPHNVIKAGTIEEIAVDWLTRIV